MTFEQWKREVDLILIEMIGLTQEDLPDWLARDSFEDGLTPSEGARACLENAYEDFGIEEFLHEY